jgi:flavin reductase (DIM6/NTAB) family NADH-FMN oxidoreductase RutF
MSELHPLAGDLAAVRRTFDAYPSGIVAIAARVDGERHVMIASSFTVGVSFDPPLCSVAVQHGSSTWPVLGRGAVLGISALGAEHVNAVRRLASRDRTRRLDGLPVKETPAGAVLLEGAAAWLECEVFAVHRAGDHDIIVLRALAASITPVSPLVLHRGQVAPSSTVMSTAQVATT